MTDQIKAACDRFLASRGHRKISYKEQMEINANKSRLRKGKFAADRMDRIAKDLADDDQDC